MNTRGANPKSFSVRWPTVYALGLSIGVVTLLGVLIFWAKGHTSWSSWQDADGKTWTATTLVNLGANESVLFACCRATSPTVEHHQGIVFPGSTVVADLPYNVGGKIDIRAFWYGTIEGRGPFIRLEDRYGEYLIDLESRTVSVIVRRDGRTFCGVVSDPLAGYSVMGKGDDLEVSAGGSRAKEVIGPLASGKGKLLTHIRER